MLGLEKKVDAIRQMQGAEETEPQWPGRSAATMGIMLALVAIVVAVGVYFGVDGKYSGRLADYETRVAAMETRMAEAMKSPAEIARKMVVANTLGEVSQKVDGLKGHLDASYQERLAKIDELVKSIQKDIAK